MRSIPSPNYGGTRGKVYWIIVHTAEGALTVDSLGNYFANPARQVSSHVGADDRETVQYVDYSQVAWTARSANPYADQIELCAFAAWTRGQWLTHGGMLEQCAQWIASRCKARGIPAVKIGPADVAARRPGVIGHVDITNGLHDGTHTDPGPNFPWDVVMARVQQILAPPPPPPPPAPKPTPTPVPVEDDMTPEDRALLEETHLFAQQARDSAYGANDRAGYILTAVNTVIVPALGKSQDPVAIASAIVQALPADIAKQVVAEMGKQLTPTPAP